MTRRSKSLLLALLTLGTALYLAADAERPSGDAASPARLKRVTVAAVEAASDHRELTFAGTTRAAKRARLAFSSSGRMVARPVEVGDRVARGQLLAKLSDQELENAVATARAALAELAARRSQSERDYARSEQLAAAKAATGEELEQRAAAVEALEAAETAAGARLTETRRRLAETSLVAPFAGTVTEVRLEPGEYAVAGAPVVTLAGDGEIEVEVEVPESVIPHLEIGDLVELRLGFSGRDADGDGGAVAGRIASLARSAAGSGRLFPVVAVFPAGQEVVVGATAELILRLTRDQALAVPIEAVVNPGGRRPAVFRVGGGAGPQRVEKIEVEVGSLVSAAGDEVRVIVRGDLQAGDLVVAGGQRGLLDGESVEVATAEVER